MSRTCWKPYDDDLACPFASEGALDLVHFPSADAGSCDKNYDTPNGCLAHGMKHRFGGVLVEPQGVNVKDNSTGTWGFGRSSMTSVSLVGESCYDEVVPEIYTDSDMPVNAKVAAGRDESDFYEAMGIVGEGPIGAFGSGHKLDGQYHHGYPGALGLREARGTDPAGASDWFSLDQSGDQTGGDWRKVFNGSSTFKDNFAAGTAFVVIRRSDAKGLQLSKLGEHQIQVVVALGLSGWVWAAPGDVLAPGVDESHLDRRERLAPGARPAVRQCRGSCRHRGAVLRCGVCNRGGRRVQPVGRRSWWAPASRRSSNSAACSRRRSRSGTGFRKS